MPARDANNATWYVLRYAEDFRARRRGAGSAAPFAGAVARRTCSRRCCSTNARGVLELQVRSARRRGRAAAGHRGRRRRRHLPRRRRPATLVVVRCDGSSAPLPCEPDVLAQPAGLALDRRGYLYVADPAGSPCRGRCSRDGRCARSSAAAVRSARLRRAGRRRGRRRPAWIYVADRDGGRIAVFSAGMKPLARRSRTAARCPASRRGRSR